jgi:CTP:molybdopterin cytidylyltransferase MocA
MKLAKRYKIAAIVAAGDGEASHPIFGRNKALLRIAGEPMVAHVVRALGGVEEIGSILVAGPLGPLGEALSGMTTAQGQPIRLVEQRNSLYDNCFGAFLRSLSDDPEPNVDEMVRNHRDAVALFFSGDSPFVTPEEIRAFLCTADMDRYDYQLGVTPMALLERCAAEGVFVPVAALNLAEGQYRPNNLHLIRPFAIGHLRYLDEYYRLRYQRDWWNTLRLMATIAVATRGAAREILYFLRMQGAMRATMKGRERLARWFRRGVPTAGACRSISRLLDTRFGLAITPSPGAALDIDNEEDFAAAAAHFGDWQRIVRRVGDSA